MKSKYSLEKNVVFVGVTVKAEDEGWEDARGLRAVRAVVWSLLRGLPPGAAHRLYFPGKGGAGRPERPGRPAAACASMVLIAFSIDWVRFCRYFCCFFYLIGFDWLSLFDWFNFLVGFDSIGWIRFAGFSSFD